MQTETQGRDVRQATGFIVRRDDRAFLISNGHVFSGRNPATGTSDHCPDAVRFMYWKPGAQFTLAEHRELLQRDGQPVWLEHPALGSRADVAALPLTGFPVDEVAIYDPWLPCRFEVGVGDDVTVVGFPFGVNIEHLAIWTRASIASEFDADYNGLPVFLVDARTREGQSGSPVITFRTGAHVTSSGVTRRGMLLLGPRPPGGDVDGIAPIGIDQFLGVYSGRIDERSDLGFVWRASVVREIIEGGCVATW